MTKISRLFTLGAAFLLGASSAAAPAEKQQLMKQIRDKFEYRPVNFENWNQISGIIKSKKPLEALAHDAPNGDSGPETDEWKLLVGKALSAGGMPLHAQFLLSTVAAKSVGTRQGFEALRTLAEIAKSQAIDETALEELAFDLDTKIDEPESRSLVAYLRARVLLRKGYPEWAQISLANMVPGTTFGEEFEFDKTLQLLKAGDSAAAYGRFESILNNPATRKETARLARLALARLVFERKDYQDSIRTYRTIELPTRERARSLNELAWSYYYDRQYGKALGAIEALKSAYFRPLLSPETLVVEMLIYRELCYYRKVKHLVQDFQNEYKQMFTAIEERKAIEHLPQFLQMAFQEGVFQKRANSIQMIRWERNEMSRLPWSDAENQRLVEQLGVKHERLLDAELTRMLKTRVDPIANWFLDLREQVWFLDYESSMRMIQANEEQTDKYDPPRANTSKPDIMFWPINDESWLDELFDYEVLLKDQCRGVLQRPRRGGTR